MSKNLSAAAALLLLVVVGPSPASAEGISKGDWCAVSVKEGHLGKKGVLIATLPKGTRFQVQEVKGDWLGTVVEINGRHVEGWLDTSEVVLAAKLGNEPTVTVPDAYWTLAKALGVFGERTKPEEEKNVKDFSRFFGQSTETQLELAKYVKQEKGDLKEFAGEIQKALDYLVKVIKRLNEHPDLVGLPRDKTRDVTNSASVTFPGAGFSSSETEREISPTESVGQLLMRVVGTLDQFRGLQQVLIKHAAKSSGPKVMQGQALVLDYIEPFTFEDKKNPFDNPATVSFTNITGQDLAHCTLVIKTIGKQEEYINVHFIEKWASGETFYSSYPTGMRIEQNKPIGKFTAADVEKLEAAIWCEQLTQEGIVYRYDDAERETDFHNWCNKLKVIAKCEDDFGLLGGKAGSKILIAFSEAPILPDGNLLGRVKVNGKWIERTQGFKNWRTMENQTLYFQYENSASNQPSNYEVTLEFNLGNWKRARTWAWEVK
jgi:hypothetical protein